MEKGIFGLDIWWLWMRWITGMALARVGNQGHLSMEKKYAQVQVQRGAREPKQRQKREKSKKRKSCENQGVTPSSLTAMSYVWVEGLVIEDLEQTSLRPCLH